MSPRSLRIIATVGHGRHQLRTAAAPSASAGRVFLHEAQDSSCQLSPDLQNPILVSWNWNCNLGVFAGGRSMHALGCGRTPFIFFVTRGFDKLYARLLRFRPSKLDNRYPGSSLSFFYNKMQFSQSTTVHSRHLQVFRKGEPSRNTASWRTTASKEGRAWAVGWQDRGRKDTERGERRETEEGQRNVIFTYLYFLLSSLLGILSGILIWPLQHIQRVSANRWTTHGAFGDRQAMHSMPFRSTSAERLGVAPQESGSGWTKISLSSILMTRLAHLLMCLPACRVALWILPVSVSSPQQTEHRAGEVANPHGLPSKIGQSAAAPRLRSCSLVKKACLLALCNQSHKRSKRSHVMIGLHMLCGEYTLDHLPLMVWSPPICRLSQCNPLQLPSWWTARRILAVCDLLIFVASGVTATQLEWWRARCYIASPRRRWCLGIVRHDGSRWTRPG